MHHTRRQTVLSAHALPALFRISSVLPLALIASGWLAPGLPSRLAAAERPDRVVADFEGADYGGWKTTGDAFGNGPAHGALPGQMAVDGFLGRGLVNSFLGGDRSTGSLVSTTFTLERQYLRFLIGGGKAPGKTALNLRVDGALVRTATGPNDKAGGSEHLDWEEWDIRDLAGRQAVIEIVDLATGGWGHINVDQLVQTDQRLPGVLTNASRALPVQGTVLNLPVKNGAPKRWVSLQVDGKLVREFEIELADGAPDWWAFLDLSPWQGKTAVLQVDRLKEDSAALKNIEVAERARGTGDLYQEKLRPQFHFTARRGWNNDPNGLVYHKGEYHLFFQHNPYGWGWGNMHWGHAVSRDLLHWEELAEALYPDAEGTMFSGSAVVDTENTTGWGTAAEKALVCIYTAAGGTSRESKDQPFTQGLAYSTDRGRTWTKHAGNPALPHLVGGNRDPKVFWYAPGKKWVMALYLDKSDYALFSSKDLKQWERMSTVVIPGTSECPEFFEIALGPDRKQSRWVFYGGDGRYFIGHFDGTTFSPESGPHSLNQGNCFYASQTYNQLPESGRRVLVAWGQVNLPGMPFNQMMDFPVELTLRPTAAGPRLFANPVREIGLAHAKTYRLPRTALRPGGANPLAAARGELFDLTVDLVPEGATEVGVEVKGVAIAYDPGKQELSCLGRKAKLVPEEGRIRLRLLVDRASIEIFGNDGSLYMPMGVLLAQQPATTPAQPPLVCYTKGGAARIETARIHELKSAWIR